MRILRPTVAPFLITALLSLASCQDPTGPTDTPVSAELTALLPSPEPSSFPPSEPIPEPVAEPTAKPTPTQTPEPTSEPAASPKESKEVREIQAPVPETTPVPAPPATPAPVPSPVPAAGFTGTWTRSWSTTNGLCVVTNYSSVISCTESTYSLTATTDSPGSPGGIVALKPFRLTIREEGTLTYNGETISLKAVRFDIGNGRGWQPATTPEGIKTWSLSGPDLILEGFRYIRQK